MLGRKGGHQLTVAKPVHICQRLEDQGDAAANGNLPSNDAAAGAALTEPDGPEPPNP